MTENATTKTSPAEEEFIQRLLALGLIKTRPPKQRQRKVRRPIPITGKPVSELLIEERR